VVVALSLGSNVGDRLSHLSFARRELARLPGTKLLKLSSVYETSPVGVRAQRAYFNAAALIETSLSPLGLLFHLKRIEAERGRRPAPRWAPRTLDIDVLTYGAWRLRSPWLTTPHPRLAGRFFVLVPLAQIAPLLKVQLPGGGSTAERLLVRLKAPLQSVKMVAAFPS
jgi:2-amino-4-hydroxy-6-hydroxymethyldihydropteridine diphosphokinase